MITTRRDANNRRRKVHLGGWKKQKPDERDRSYKLQLHTAYAAAPPRVDLRPICPAVEDQGDLGACTANMFAGLIEANEIASARADARKPVAPAVEVSRLFQYYATRLLGGTTKEDSGASIRDTIKAGARYGVLSEARWPYVTTKFTMKPPKACFAEALAHRVSSYHPVADGDIATMKSVLAQGKLVGFGFQVYASFLSAEVARTGKVPMPHPSEMPQGGHAVALAGYDEARQAFLVRNSWGRDWGLNGYCWMPYAYVGKPDLATDFWVVLSSPV